ncbi:hypothetical protein M1105_00610 [Limibaculum sp. FT325]|uniref:hypothetical protein n=1 Tax=Thermohalobaculum sediminis TaxID=2939436 RepID=UPI0020C0C1FD|nr:hypothetical protein [Limibaculum sediminis]MCL5775498.1 hypothetical protein [Limibaculum sediminis]
MVPARQAYPYALAALTALGLSGCGEEGARDEQAAAPIVEREALRHDDKRFLVRYGALPYRVNVQYVDMIGQSVIAVRRGAEEAVPEGWPELAMEAARPQPSGVPFEDEGFREVALDIAERVSRNGGICPTEGEMKLRKDEHGDARTMYRATRGAWVVFAYCPDAVGS